MISRPILQVTGATGIGKTRFIERLLEALPESFLCARGVAEGSLRNPEETRPSDHPELRRYLKAGATDAVLYRFPARFRDPISFFDSDLMQDWSDAVVIEGDSPVADPDLVIHLAPPLPETGSIFIRTPKGRTGGTAIPEDLMEALAASMGDKVLDALIQNPKALQAMRFEASKPTSRKPAEGWALAPGYEGLRRAGMVLVPTLNELALRGAQRLLDELPRLRKDPELFRAIMGPLASRVPITALAVDFSNPKDPAFRKALARVKRTLRKEGA